MVTNISCKDANFPAPKIDSISSLDPNGTVLIEVMTMSGNGWHAKLILMLIKVLFINGLSKKCEVIVLTAFLLSFN